MPAAIADLSAANLLPMMTPVCFSDLPGLLGPYAVTAPVYVYLMNCGNIQATRFRLRGDAELILVLGPRGRVPPLEN